MTFFNSVRRRLRRRFDALAYRARFERDLRDELRQHLDARTSDLIDAGAEPEEAARQARVEFGAMERYKEQCRDERGFAAFRPFHGLGGRRPLRRPPPARHAAVRDLRRTVPGCRHRRDDAVYSILCSLSKPSPSRSRSAPCSSSRPRHRDAPALGGRFRRYDQGAAESPASAPGRGHSSRRSRRRSRTELVDGEAVTGEYFATLGVRAALGRTIEPADDETGARGRRPRRLAVEDPIRADRVDRRPGGQTRRTPVRDRRRGAGNFAGCRRQPADGRMDSGARRSRVSRAPLQPAATRGGCLARGRRPAPTRRARQRRRRGAGRVARQLDAIYPLADRSKTAQARRWSARLVNSRRRERPTDGRMAPSSA